MTMRKIIYSALLLLISLNLSAQQEKHFSMFYASPSLLNAGANATMGEDFRLFTNFRMQWLSAVDKPFRTNAFSAETKLFKNTSTNGYIGTGLHFFNDVTGDYRIATTSFAVPINYVIQIGRFDKFSIGVLPGYFQQSPSGVEKWDSQWNGLAFDPAVNSGEGTIKTVNTFDIGSGLYYSRINPNTNGVFKVGFAANHLTSQAVNFKSLTSNLYRQYVGHLDWNCRFYNSNVGFSPMAYAFFQGPNKNIVAGVSLDYLLQQPSRRTDFVQEKSISFGLYHRWKDAIIASVNFKYSGYEVGLSYDANISNARVATNTVGAFEIFFKWASFYGNGKRYIH